MIYATHNKATKKLQPMSKATKKLQYRFQEWYLNSKNNIITNINNRLVYPKTFFDALLWHGGWLTSKLKYNSTFNKLFYFHNNFLVIINFLYLQHNDACLFHLRNMINLHPIDFQSHVPY